MGGRCPRLATERSHGSWYLRLELGSGPGGIRRRVRRGGFPTRKAAQEELRRLRGPTGCPLTVAEWLGLWLALAALVAIKPGEHPRLIYRAHTYRGRKEERKGFGEGDYIRLLDAAHQQLGGPIVVVWDNCETHGAPPGGESLARGTTGLSCLVEDLSALGLRAALAVAGPTAVSR